MREVQGLRVLLSNGLNLVAAVTLAASQPATVEFNRDIRPIFSDRCYACHGPDQAKRKSKLRLDIETGAKVDLGGRFGIVPGDLSNGEVIRRVTADGSRGMPPACAGNARLAERE